jgi:bifunctional non-homologous end joining protein LigD
MAEADPLREYNAKRDFTKTKEPAGKREKGPKNGSANRFIVQKHDATRLHFDFRLELDGVLKSWAVTRGPSLDPADKRLAVRTEDHPLSYATFEGTIPKGSYGGGTVMLWDRGTWEPAPGKDPRKTLAEGHLHFTLHGERMKGEWLLIRLKPRGREKRENWLLRKIGDEHAGEAGGLVDHYLTSVSTGRVMAEIEAGKAPAAQPGAAAGAAKSGRPARRPAGRGAPPEFRPLQLATLVDHVPPGDRWVHEVKFDGYRCLLSVGGGKAKAYTRTGQDWSAKFPTVVQAGEALDVGSALIDGEIVALDKDGKPSFSALQEGIKGGGAGLRMFAFDLLELDGEEIADLPLVERKQRLAALIGEGSDGLTYAEHVKGGGEKLFEALCRQGYEGVVSKKADAGYAGRRAQGWLKIKCMRRQEFVLVGWSKSDKGRGFRSLLLGLNGPDGLQYAGRVGTGFDMRTIDELSAKMKPLAIDKPALDVPREARRGARWIRPELVAEIAFTEFTHDGVLRHPSFIGLREDKPASEVVRETPADAPSPGPHHGIRISNPDRVVYPEAGVTKGDLVAYYETVAEVALPWMANRPLTLVRCPQGRAKTCFFQKHDAGSFGDMVKAVPIREKDGSEEPYLYVDDAAGLIACLQMGTLEFHGWGSPVSAIERPDRMVFDLDPAPGIDFDTVKRAAKDIRDTLVDLGLVSFPLLSGGKGVHIVVPLDSVAEWPAVKDFSHRFAQALAANAPDRFIATMSKAKREGRIFIDWLRNQRGATAVLPYSTRARANAPIAAPVSWEELEDIATPALFTVPDAAKLVERAAGKALAQWGQAAQTLPDL